MRWFLAKLGFRLTLRNSVSWNFWDGAENIGEFLGWLILIIFLVSGLILLFWWLKELIYSRTPEYKQKVKEYEIERERRKKREEEDREYFKRLKDLTDVNNLYKNR